MLTFDEAEHRYYWKGSPVPNVTGVLSSLIDLSHIPADRLEIARQKGVAAHKMVELHSKGDLDEASLPEWMKPVFERWLQFVKDTGFRVIFSEKKVFHPMYRYAGTLDLFGEMHVGLSLIDVKRSFLSGVVIGYQTAAYKGALVAQEGFGKEAKRFALKLTENGPYRLEPYPDESDFTHFLTCLSYQRLKEKHA